jgi:hypothetical protein
MGLKSLRVAARRSTRIDLWNAVLETAFFASLRNAYSN